MKKLLMFFAASALVASVVGCKALRADSCLKPGAYVGAKSDKSLVVPAGMDVPDTRAALKIPQLQQPAKPRAAAAGCLDLPPKFEVPKASPPSA